MKILLPLAGASKELANESYSIYLQEGHFNMKDTKKLLMKCKEQVKIFSQLCMIFFNLKQRSNKPNSFLLKRTKLVI